MHQVTQKKLLIRLKTQILLWQAMQMENISDSYTLMRPYLSFHLIMKVFL